MGVWVGCGAVGTEVGVFLVRASPDAQRSPLAQDHPRPMRLGRAGLSMSQKQRACGSWRPNATRHNAYPSMPLKPKALLGGIGC